MVSRDFRAPTIFTADSQPTASGDPEPPPKTPPIAKTEKGKIAAQINRVDVGLDEYDDIFSDFDPSPYTSRLISKDFIDEIMRRHRETKEGQIEVRFSIPEKLRNPGIENVIRTRLKEYFKVQAEKVDDDLTRRDRRGYAMIVGGLALVTLHRFLTDNLTGGTGHEIYRWFENPMELFGWITTWTGIDRIFVHRPEDLIERRKAFERFSGANFIFISAELLKEGMLKPAAKRPKGAWSDSDGTRVD